MPSVWMGRGDGIIGGDPCQSHSSLANLVRGKGLEAKVEDELRDGMVMLSCRGIGRTPMQPGARHHSANQVAEELGVQYVLAQFGTIKLVVKQVQLHVGIQFAQGFSRRLYFGFPQVGGVVHDLPL